MEEIYGVEMSRDMVHRITDKILPVIREWQDHPLEPVYPIVFMDGMVFNVPVLQNRFRICHFVLSDNILLLVINFH